MSENEQPVTEKLTEKQVDKHKVRNFSLELLETFISSIVVLFVIYTTIAMPEQVWGASMEPTFHTGERILVDKVSKYVKDFNRGDIVVLNPPGNQDVDYIKRIVGMPGEIVKIMNCQVFITKDGKKFQLDEPYLSANTCTSEGPQLREGRSIKLEAGQYLVLGDNRNHSADSRYFGLVDKSKIVGRVLFRFWPLNKAGWL